MSDDMRFAIEPKSDQWNFDDFADGSTMTVTITKAVVHRRKEQPVELSLSNGPKLYRPGKSMGRVLVHCWGIDSQNYVGKSLTLYGDPNVTFGSLKVGGIRISHMSAINGKQVIPLTATKGVKKLFTVLPLAPAAGDLDVDALNEAADVEAAKGVVAYQTFFKGLSNAARAALLPRHEALKVTAAEADAKVSDDGTTAGDEDEV